MSSCLQGKALRQPPRDASRHHLVGPAQISQSNSRAVGAVAMRTGTVHDENRVRRIWLLFAFGDLRVQQTDTSPNVTRAEILMVWRLKKRIHNRRQ